MATSPMLLHASLTCTLCRTIESGNMEEVRKQIQAERDQCECETKQPVYRVIKVYQRFLCEAREDNMAKSAVWKSPNVWKSNTRALILETVAKLLAGGAAINYTTGLETPLMAALSTCDEQLLWTLLDFKADVNLCDGVEDMNALGLAILLNEVALVEMLLKHGGKVNSPCCGTLVPIQLAMNKNSAVSNLLIQYGADVHFLRTISLDDKLFTSQSPLMVAIMRKNVHLGRLLLEHGEDVNQTFPDSLECPIHQAVRNLDLDMIELLVQFGADLNRPNFERHTPVGLALLTDDLVATEIAKRLILAGASPNRRTRISFFQKTYTPLHIACFKGNFEFVRFLVEEVCGRLGYLDEEMEAPVSESATLGNKDRYMVPDNTATSFQERYFKLLPRNDRCWGSTSSALASVSAGRIVSQVSHLCAMTFQPGKKDYHERSEVYTTASTVEGRSSNSNSPERSVSSPIESENVSEKTLDCSPVKSKDISLLTETVQNGDETRFPTVSEYKLSESFAANQPALHCTYHHRRKDHGVPSPRFLKNKTSSSLKPETAPDSYNIVFSIGDEVIGRDASKKQTSTIKMQSKEKREELLRCQPGAQDSSSCVIGDNSEIGTHDCSGTEKELQNSIPCFTEDIPTSDFETVTIASLTAELTKEDNRPMSGETFCVAGPSERKSECTSAKEPIFQMEFGSAGYYGADSPTDDGDLATEEVCWQDMFYMRELQAGMAESKYHSVVRFLNQEGSDGSTALFMAVYDGNMQLVNYLLDKGADPHFSSHHGNFFHAAVLSQSVPLIRRALELDCSINEHNVFGNSPLTLVARLDLPEACELLVRHGADMNSRDRYGETPLLASVYFGCEMNARTLIQHGAALDLVDDNHTSAIYWAIFNNRQRTLKLLLMAGAHFTPQILRQYPRNIRVMNSPSLLRFIHHYVHQPRSLQDLATIRVRVHMGQKYGGCSILPYVDHLPIPNRLKRILHLQHFIEAIDQEADNAGGIRYSDK